MRILRCVIATLLVVPVARAEIVALGREFQVNTYTTGYQGSPSVETHPDGRFVVVWQDGDYHRDGVDGDLSGVRGQRFDARGTLLGSEFQVNSHTTDPQGRPVLAVDAGGGFAVVWVSSLDFDPVFVGKTNAEIQAQRFSSGGDRLGEEFRINTYTTRNQLDPAIAMGSGGEFVVAWWGVVPDDDRVGVRGQRLASDGGFLGAEFRVNMYTTGSIGTRPSVAMEAGGDFVIVWHGYSTDDRVESLRGQRFGFDGTRLGSEFQINESHEVESDSLDAVAVDADGGFVVVWTSSIEVESPRGTRVEVVRARRFDSNGTRLATEFQVSPYPGFDQSDPAIAMNAAGAFAVLWQDDRLNPPGGGLIETDVWGQLYTADGSPSGAEFGANSYTTGFQGRPSAAMTSEGDLIVTWLEIGTDLPPQDGSDTGIQAQRFACLTEGGRCAFFADGFESGDTSGWSQAGP